MQASDFQRARQYLLDRERVIEVVQWHWVWLARPVAAGLLILVPLLMLTLSLPVDSRAMPVALAFIAVDLGWLAWKVYEWHVERLVVTDRRIMLVTGVFNRRVAMMPLRKVTDMTFERSLLGRMFGPWGWGTFVLESAGQDQALHRISPLPHPEALYRCVSQEIFYGGSKGAPSDADDGTGSIDEEGRQAEPFEPRERPHGVPAAVLDLQDTGPIERPWWSPEDPRTHHHHEGMDEPGRD